MRKLDFDTSFSYSFLVLKQILCVIDVLPHAYVVTVDYCSLLRVRADLKLLRRESRLSHTGAHVAVCLSAILLLQHSTVLLLRVFLRVYIGLFATDRRFTISKMCFRGLYFPLHSGDPLHFHSNANID